MKFLTVLGLLALFGSSNALQVRNYGSHLQTENQIAPAQVKKSIIQVPVESPEGQEATPPDVVIEESGDNQDQGGDPGTLNN